MPDLNLRSACVQWMPLLIGLALSGCSSFDRASSKIVSVVTPYKMDIVQGNVVTREQVAALKPGMERRQVREILGTALLTSLFHADRWDYVFTLKSQGNVVQTRKVTVHFKNEVMERVEAQDLPSEAEFVATLKSTPVSGTLPPLEASPEALRAFPVTPKAPPVATAPVTPPANYPPLEPAGK